MCTFSGVFAHLPTRQNAQTVFFKNSLNRLFRVDGGEGLCEKAHQVRSLKKLVSPVFQPD